MKNKKFPLQIIKLRNPTYIKIDFHQHYIHNTILDIILKLIHFYINLNTSANNL